MNKRLKMLEELQEIDLAIDGLTNGCKALLAELAEMEQILTSANEELAGLENQVSALEKEKVEFENNHALEMENINRSEAHMKEIKTNKEYQAVGREIAAARKQTSELEEQALQKLTLIDEINLVIVSKKETLAELQKNSEVRCSEKQAELKKLQKNIDTDTARRESITKELPAGLVKRYGSLRLQRRGYAIAIARDGYCLGCNMNLPPQMYNSLFGSDEVTSCPHCQRILVLKQPAPEQPAA